MTAHTFKITDRGGNVLALAVLAAEARYVSLKLRESDRLVRRHAKPDEWRSIEHKIALGLTTEPMASGVFHDVLAAGAEDRRVAWLAVMPINVTDPLATVAALDAHLKSQPIELRQRMKQETPDGTS